MAASALLGMLDGSDWVRGVRDDRLKSCPAELLARGRVFDNCCGCAGCGWSTAGRSDSTAAAGGGGDDGGGGGGATAATASATCLPPGDDCC